jgi:hypothetical protein
MDNYQSQLLGKIKARRSGSLHNHVTILDSNQHSVCTPFTSIIKIHDQKFATVHYKQDYFDYSLETPIVEKIVFHTDLIKDINGTTPTRYRNFLNQHYIVKSN